jgi:CRP-like cAMP-binding protein
VADALVILYRKYYTNEAQPGSIVISRGSLASIAGTAKESMIRTLSDFKNEKLIDINDDGSIQILNLKKLELMLN